MATVDKMRHLAPRTDRPPAVGAQPPETKGRMAKVATTTETTFLTATGYAATPAIQGWPNQIPT